MDRCRLQKLARFWTLHAVTAIFLFTLKLTSSYADDSDKVDCFYVIGNGIFNHYGSYPKFEDHVRFFENRWQNICKSNQILMSGGPGDSFIINSYSDVYSLRPTSLTVNLAATKKNVGKVIDQANSQIVYGVFDDHGGENGTALFDGEMTPDSLRARLRQKSGTEFHLFFNHCYSGPMLESLYDKTSGETYGCGIALIGNEEAILSKLENFDSSEINKLTTVGTKKINIGQDFEMNTQMITSDYFLMNYRDPRKASPQSKPPIRCVDDGEKILGTDQIAIHAEIDGLSDRLAGLEIKQKQLSNKLDAGELQGITLTQLGQLASDYAGARNKLFLAALKKTDPVFSESYKKAYAAYQDCIVKANESSSCANKQLREAQAWLLQSENRFGERHRLSEIAPADRPKGISLKDYSLTFNQAQSTVDQFDLELRKATQITRRIDIIKKKINALNEIEKNNDVKAYRVWLNLKKCENSGQF